MPHHKKGGVPELPFETARERNLYQYYQPSILPSLAPHVRRSSYDTTLSTFAQLATLRLKSRRALISLIDRTNQYILAEATQASSLQPDSVHNGQDELWFGCITLPRSRGICETALEILPTSSSGQMSPLVIHDLTQDDKFQHRPFVTNYPSLQFYAAIPIRTKLGFNIGTLCIMDDRSREGLSNIEIGFMNDITIAIMAYLEMVRVKEAHRRSENMVKGLGQFVEGRSPLHEWWLEIGSDTESQQQDPSSRADVQRSDKSEPQQDLDSGPTSKEHISVGKITESKVAAQFQSLKLPPLSQPRPVVSIPANAQAGPTLEIPSLLATQREGKEISTTFDVRNQEIPSSPTPASDISAMLPEAQDVSPISKTGGAQHSAEEKHNTRTSSIDLQESALSEKLKETFSRASSIIRECIEVDGTIFLDASIRTFGGQTDEPDDTLSRSIFTRDQSEESTVSSSEEERWTAPSGGAQNSEVSPRGTFPSLRPKKTSAESGDKKICGILGFSTENKSSFRVNEASENYVPVTEAFLQSLLHKYPRGHVFNLSEESIASHHMNDTQNIEKDVAQPESRSSDKTLHTGKFRKGSKKAEVAALLHMLPGARSVVLFPLWDSHRQRWFAGSFAWTTKSTRILTRAEDLSYLAAFGNSIMAEVARLDTMAADRAKSDFISSVSHELRSPLHGILASVEFLQDTAVDPFQNSMVDTIERCGRTLLDTIQHVLDFAKINYFIRPTRNDGNDVDPGASDLGPILKSVGLSANIDLSVITEDVVDAVYAGHEFQGNSSLEVTDEATGFPSEGLRRSKSNDNRKVPDRPSSKKERLAIIMDIGWRSKWTFNTQSGALRRVLMNLFGNALKYTDEGWVKISLQSEDIKPVLSESQQSIVTITVSDSGRGISQEFLHSHLFTPFSQEDPLNPGTGLGLSIVLQIVHSLGGTIDVHSEQGVGTEVKVSLTLNQVTRASPSLPLSAKYENSIASTREKTRGLTLGLVGFEDHSNVSEIRGGILGIQPRPSISFQTSLKNMAINWFGMKVVASESWKASPPDIYIADEKFDLHGPFDETPTIILCSSASVYYAYARTTERSSLSNNNRLVHFVSKPCGPHKLAKALAYCLGHATQSSTNSRSPLSPLGNLNSSTSPQSLFTLSPDSSFQQVELHSQHEYFPVNAAPPLGKSSEASRPSVLTTDSTNARNRQPVLLLVEDNHINLKLLETFVKKNGHEYDTAENGLLALQAFQNTQRLYDIVFMDISMPVMNGIDSARGIRKLERERGQKPVIIVALTGLASANVQQEAFSSGINVFLAKPVSFNQLRKFLNDWTPDMEIQATKVSK